MRLTRKRLVWGLVALVLFSCPVGYGWAGLVYRARSERGRAALRAAVVYASEDLGVLLKSEIPAGARREGLTFHEVYAAGDRRVLMSWPPEAYWPKEPGRQVVFIDVNPPVNASVPLAWTAGWLMAEDFGLERWPDGSAVPSSGLGDGLDLGANGLEHPRVIVDRDGSMWAGYLDPGE